MSLRARCFYAALQLSFLGATALGCVPDVDIPERDGEDDDDLVSPSNPSELSQVLVIPGATRVQGTIPSATPSSTSAPVIEGGSSLSVTSGGQAVLSLSYQSSTGYQNCYVQVRGASDYFLIPGSQSGVSGQIQIPVNIPSRVPTSR